MKEKDILNAIGDLQDDMLLDAAPEERKKARVIPWGRIGAAAACAAVVLAGAWMAVPYLSTDDPAQTTTDWMYMETGGLTQEKNYVFSANHGIFGASTEEETGEAIAIYQSYESYITDERYATFDSAHVIDPIYVGEKLDDVEVKAFWYYHSEKKEEDIEYLRAEVYEILGVDTNAAVCVKYLDKGDALTTTHYYVFANTEADFDSLQEFYSIYAAKRYFSVRSSAAQYVWNDRDVNTRIYNYSDAVAAKLAEMLLSCDGEKKILTEEAYAQILSESQEQIRLRFDLVSWGFVNYPIFMTDSGYLLMTWYGETVYFSIGKENAEAMLHYIYDNGETPIYAEDGTITVETTQS